MSMNKDKFDSTLRSIKKRGSKVTSEFTSIVVTGVQLYYGETNRNIQVINDLVDCAQALKGLRTKALVEYLSQVIPHSNGGTKGGHLFGKMDKDLKAKMDRTWTQFLLDNPVWHEYTDEKPPVPFDLVAFLKSIKGRIEKAHTEGNMDAAGLQTFKTEIAKFAFDEDTVPDLKP